MSKNLIVAIDGPAASGKGTLARRLATELSLPHLDTGLTYRAVANALLRAGSRLDDEKAAVSAAHALDLLNLDKEVLSSHQVGTAASKVAMLSALRQELVQMQRDFAKTPPGAVLDGRDIGTVVCPDADVKLFVTASAHERATRRWNEMRARGDEASFDDVLEDIHRRDERDMSRADSPLEPAKDAHLLDTSQMDIETAFKTAMNIVKDIQPG